MYIQYTGAAVYIQTYIYKCMHIYNIYTYNIQVLLYLFKHTCINVCICVHIYRHKHVCIHVCILCEYVCTHVYICIHSNIYMYTFFHVYIFIYIYLHVYTCMHIFLSFLSFSLCVCVCV